MNSLIKGIPLDILDETPIYFSGVFCSFFFFPANCELSTLPQDPAPENRKPKGSHRPKLMISTCNPLFGHNLLSCTK